jgi:hypothetical protein
MRVLGFILFALLASSVGRAQNVDEPPESDRRVQFSKAGILSERLSQLRLRTEEFGSKAGNGQSQTAPVAATQPDDYVVPTAHTRFTRYLKSTVGPFSLLRTAASSAIDQWDDSPEEWEQGAKGYGRRFASNCGKNMIRQSTQYGLSEALRLDTGFEKSKRKGFWPRVGDALVQNITSRNRSGKRVVSVPIIAGAYAGSIIPAETWYPDRYSYKDGLRWGTYSLATGFGINLIREFVFNW